MKLNAIVKSSGRKRGIAGRDLDLPGMPRTLRELIEQTARLMVDEFAEKKATGNLLPYLTEQEIGEEAGSGRIGFGAVYGEKSPDADQAVSAAILAFEDGLYRVFVRREEVTGLDVPLTLADGDEVVFMRFTMLAGGYWSR